MLSRILGKLALFSAAAFVVASCSSTKFVKVTVDPPEAVIYLDGTNVGTGTFEKILDFSDHPSYEFEAKLEKFVDQKLTVSYKPEAETEYTIKLKRLYSISVPLKDFAVTKTRTGMKAGINEMPTIAYYDSAEPPGNIRKLGLVTSNKDSNMFYGGPVLSPNEDFMLYHLLKGEGKRRVSQIRMHKVGAKSTTIIVNEKNTDALFPVPAQDGCLYTSNRLKKDEYTLWLKAYKGTKIGKKSDGFTQNFSSSISPSGDKIACTGLNTNGEELKIFTITYNEGRTSEFGAGMDPQISPDGKMIMFLKKAPKSTNTQIWLMDFNGNDETQLTNNKDFSIKDARWSPDGSVIVFSSNQKKDDKGRNNFDIWMMKADGSGVEQLTFNGSHDDEPCFDRHGETIYFRSNRGTTWNIWGFTLGERFAEGRRGFQMKK